MKRPDLRRIGATLFEVDDAAMLAILRERRNHSRKGYDATHDDRHDKGEIAQAAAFYAMASTGRWDYKLYPWTDVPFVEANTNTRRELLVIAGSLIIAEIERLDRAEAR